MRSQWGAFPLIRDPANMRRKAAGNQQGMPSARKPSVKTAEGPLTRVPAGMKPTWRLLTSAVCR